MTIREFEYALADAVDTEYREELAGYITEKNGFTESPLYIQCRGTEAQKKALEDAYESELTPECVEYIRKRMEHDFQIGRFNSVAAVCLR